MTQPISPKGLVFISFEVPALISDPHKTVAEGNDTLNRMDALVRL